MALADLSVLEVHAATPFPPGYPKAVMPTFFSPSGDDLHAVLVDVLGSASKSLICAMYGFDDPALAEIITAKLADPSIYVQLTLDSSQAAGKREKEILAGADYPASSIAVGRSRAGGIQHLKVCLVDGLDMVTGSTNWSASGETKQDNVLHILRDPLLVARARAELDIVHAACKAQEERKAAA